MKRIIIIFIITFAALFLLVAGIRWYLRQTITIDEVHLFANKMTYSCSRGPEEIGYLVLDTDGAFEWSYTNHNSHLSIVGKYELAPLKERFNSVALYPEENTTPLFLVEMLIYSNYDQLQLVTSEDTYIFRKKPDNSNGFVH